MAELRERGCDVIGISTDDIETHQRWLKLAPHDGGLGSINFPLAADPEGKVCQKYGVYAERQRVALRGLFIVDPNGVLQYQVVHSLSVGRSAAEILRVLDALQSGGLCPGERPIDGPTMDVEANLQPGRLLGPYRIESTVGRGSFGTVVRARDTMLDRTVALKVLRKQDEGAGTDALLSEARAAAALNHPNLCAVYTVDTSNGASMIVMEFVEGRTLAELIDAGPMSVEQARAFARQIAFGMASAHDAGVIHGDLKPGNILITPDNQVKIMDFGLARRIVPDVDDDTLPQDANTSGGLSGTLGYLAPERARGEAPSPASDTFAFGLIFYEMLTGQRAVTGKNLLDTLQMIDRFDGSHHIARLPDQVQGQMGRVLAREPSERPAMRELANWLAEGIMQL